MPIVQRHIELDETQEQDLVNHVDTALRKAIEVHSGYEAQLAKYKAAYKALPKVEKKTFPWDGASNIVVPHVAVAVDAMVAKMMATLFGAVNFAEIQIKNPGWEPLEKQIRDWIDIFISSSGARDRLREIFHDAAQDGDAYVEPRWIEETRIWHTYDDQMNVQEQVVPGYVGVKFFTIPADAVIVPMGFDSWEGLPWFATKHIYTWDEMVQEVEDEVFSDIDSLKPHKKERDDLRYGVVQKAKNVSGGIEETYTIYQLRGRFPIPVEGVDEPVYEEVILAYSLDARKFVRKIYNPFFGKFRHLVKIPFLVQPHEVHGMGVAEQVIQFQEIASTAINQVVDAATAANAGIVITDPESSLARDPEIHPGKIVISEAPDKTRVLNLSEPSSALQLVVEFAGRMQQVRSAVSDYNLGLESGVVGSRATATGTTALIGQGNLRFNVSIDEMKNQIQELIYLTIQQEQQFRPQGTPMPDGSILQWPKEDPRLALGLTIRLTSDQINRTTEIQSYQLLFNMLNEYYMRFMQTVTLVMNPSFPPPMKLAAIQVINASQNIVKRMVERFSIENVDEVVPSIMQAMQAMQAMMGGQDGMGAPTPGGPGVGPAAAGAGAPALPPAGGAGAGAPAAPPPPGPGEIPY
jgi:hypothetical protein